MHVLSLFFIAGSCWLESLSNGGVPVTFTVQETAGLRRFGYPVTATLELAPALLARESSARVLDADGKEVPAQCTAMSHWPDGSVRTLDVDLILSPGPHEMMTFTLAPGTVPENPPTGGLVVAEGEDDLQIISGVMSHRIRKDGQPLVASLVMSQQEFLAPGGIATSQAVGEIKVLKRGPFCVLLDCGNVQLEFCSSKSWIKITQQATEVQELSVDAHFALTELPLTWDFGVGSWIYGQMHDPGQSLRMLQKPQGWELQTADPGEPASLYARGKTGEGWGHLCDAKRVVAFGLADAATPAEATVELTGEGHFRAAAKRQALTVYFHVVGQLVEVNAATSPPSMLSPLVVNVKK